MNSVSATPCRFWGADCSAVSLRAAPGAAVLPSRLFSSDLARWRADACRAQPGWLVSLAGLFRPASTARGVSVMGVMVWTDEQMLQVLDLIDEFGLTASQVAERFGVSRNAIIGLRNRVLSDLKKSERGHVQAQRPENRDGGMVQGWWRAGLQARGAA